MPRLGGNYSAGGVHVPTECLRNTPIPPHARCKYQFWSSNFYGITVHCISCYTLHRKFENCEEIWQRQKLLQNLKKTCVILQR